MNIILCGMMGVGKSTVGIKVAELTKRRWVDTDVLITNRYGKINDIFEYYGEEYFRQLESEIVNEISQKDEQIISTGGGLVLKWENADLLKRNGKIIFLNASLETLLTRVQGEERPLLRHTGAREKLLELLAERTPVYSHVADYVIETDGKSAEEVAAEVVAIMGEL